MEAVKDQFGRYPDYVVPDVSGQHDTIKAIINMFADAILTDKSDDEKRVLLADAPKANDIVTAFVMEHLPEGAERVDGKTVRPILMEVLAERVALLPEVEEDV